GFANFLNPRAHHLAFVGDEHNLISLTDRERANDVAGFLASFHGNDAFAAARLPPVIIERRAFANSIFARDQQHGVWVDIGAGHHVLAFHGANALDADSVAALIA